MATMAIMRNKTAKPRYKLLVEVAVEVEVRVVSAVAVVIMMDVAST